MGEGHEYEDDAACVMSQKVLIGGKARVDVGCMGGGESGACDLGAVWRTTRGECCR